MISGPESKTGKAFKAARRLSEAECGTLDFSKFAAKSQECIFWRKDPPEGAVCVIHFIYLTTSSPMSYSRDPTLVPAGSPRSGPLSRPAFTWIHHGAHLSCSPSTNRTSNN